MNTSSANDNNKSNHNANPVELEDVVSSLEESREGREFTTPVSSSSTQEEPYHPSKKEKDTFRQGMRRPTASYGTLDDGSDEESEDLEDDFPTPVIDPSVLYSQRRQRQQEEEERKKSHEKKKSTVEKVVTKKETRTASANRKKKKSNSVKRVQLYASSSSSDEKKGYKRRHPYVSDEDDDLLALDLQQKEREFDAKIREIDDTFNRAGKHIVVRDDIIDRLQRELDALRAKQHVKEGREQHLNQLIVELRQQHGKQGEEKALQTEEVQRLRDSLANAEAHAKQQETIIVELRELLANSDNKRREEQAKNQKQLRKLQKHMDDIQQRYTQAQQSSEELQQANGATQTRLIEAELQLRNTIQQENKTCKTLWLQNQALQEEVEAVHLSNVRLLHLMSQVPVLKDYLEWNEINSEFVFLGYPTRYFHQQNSDDKFNESGDTTARPSAKSNGKPHPASTSLLFNGTGVEDGVYAGVSPSKNVWLSGEWADHLRLILSAENTFTRLKRIKVWELEEAARLCDNLPTGSDLLQCRRKDKDYWVPYKVFTEAQAFKNKYYPKIPALSHFYPFLMRLNHIWNDKLSDRTKALKRENSQLKQKLSKLENSASDGSRFLSLPANPHSNHNNYREVAPRSNGMNRSNINDTNIHYNNSNTYEVLLDISRELSALQREHEKLRREVRLRVTSQGSLHLFHLYDVLVRKLGSQVRELTEQRTQQVEEEVARVDHLDARQVTYRSRKERMALPMNEEDTDSSEEEDYRQEQKAKKRRDAKRKSKKKEKEYSDDDDEEEPNHRHEMEIKWTSLIQRLLNLLRDNNSKVCQVGEALTSQTADCCNDMQQLIQSLQQHVISNSTINYQNSYVENSTSEIMNNDNNNNNNNSSTQEALRRKYGDSGFQTPNKNSVSPSVIMQVAESVLDFSNVLQYEVLQAAEALRMITNDTLRETENL